MHSVTNGPGLAGNLHLVSLGLQTKSSSADPDGGADKAAERFGKTPAAAVSISAQALSLFAAKGKGDRDGDGK